MSTEERFLSVVTRFYQKFNPDKTEQAQSVVDNARSNNFSCDDVMEMLYEKYGVNRFQPSLGRKEVVDLIKQERPSASTATIEDAIREVEWNGGTTIADVVKLIPLDANETTPKPKETRQRANSHAKALEADKVMEEEAREWLLQMLSCSETFAEYQATLRDQSHPLVSCLQDGAILWFVAQRLTSPESDPPAKLPRRGGFFSKDLVVQFLKVIQEPPFAVIQDVTFSAPDLDHPERSRRQVVTCLLALAKSVHALGLFAEATPEIVQLEADIDRQAQGVSEEQLEEAFASDKETGSNPPGQEDDADDDVPHSRGPLISPPADEEVQGISHVDCPDVPSSSTVSKPDSTLPTVTYKAKASDPVDELVAKTLLAIPSAGQGVRRWRNQGEYIVVHPVTGKKTLVYVRNVRTRLMVRVGGGWELFSDYLERRMVGYEHVPVGTHTKRQQEARRRDTQ